MEGYLFGLPAIAFSMVQKGHAHLESAARVCAGIVERFRTGSLPAPFLLNVNIPDRQYSQLRGLACTRLGKRHPSEPVVRTVSPRGDTIYWVGAAGEAADASPGTDFHATAAGHVSVTPLQIDLTHTGLLESVSQWLGQGRL